MLVTYIILEDSVILSKKDYQQWKQIQDEYYETYKTNFPPLSLEELIAYFEDDFGDEDQWPFRKTEIIEFFEDDSRLILRTE